MFVFREKRARNSKLTRWFADSVIVVMWAAKDRLVSKVMPRSCTEVTTVRDKPLIFKLGVIGMGPTHKMLHLLTAISYYRVSSVGHQSPPPYSVDYSTE